MSTRHLVPSLAVMLAPIVALGQYAPLAGVAPLDPFGWDASLKVYQTWSAWNATGTNFGLYSAASTAATTPTLDCWATDWSGSGNWTCNRGSSSFTGTLSGNPTQKASPFYSAGFSSSADNAVAFDGTGDRFGFGDVLDAAGDYTICAVFKVTSWPSSYSMIASKDGASAGTRSYELYIHYAAGVPYIRNVVFMSGGSSDLILLSSPSLNNWYAVCAAYDYAGSGSSTLDGSVNGSNVTANTGLLGPLVNSSTAYQIGAQDSASNYHLTGHIYRVMHWDGWAASSSQLQALSKSLMGLFPEGKELTFAHTSSTMCRPGFGAQEFHYLGLNFPCWTSRGLRSWKGGSNGIASGYTEAIGNWSAAGSCAVTPDQYVAPDGATTMDLLDTTGGTYQSSRYSSVTLGSTKYTTLSGWARAATGTTTASLYVSHATEPITTCTGEVISGDAVAGQCVIDQCSSTKNCACPFTVGTSPSRVALHTTTANAQTAFVTAMAPGNLCVSSGWVAAQAGFWGMQMESGKLASPYYPIGAGNWTGEFIYFANPLASAAIQPVTIAAQVSYTNWAFGDSGIVSTPISYGSMYTNNTFAVRLLGDGTSAAYFLNNSGLAATANAANISSLTALSPYWFSVGYTGDANPRYWSNNAYNTSVTNGANATISSQPANIYIGSSGSSYNANGYISKVRVCKGSKAKDCAR